MRNIPIRQSASVSFAAIDWVIVAAAAAEAISVIGKPTRDAPIKRSSRPAFCKTRNRTKILAPTKREDRAVKVHIVTRTIGPLSWCMISDVAIVERETEGRRCLTPTLAAGSDGSFLISRRRGSASTCWQVDDDDEEEVGCHRRMEVKATRSMAEPDKERAGRQANRAERKGTIATDEMRCTDSTRSY